MGEVQTVAKYGWKQSWVTNPAPVENVQRVLLICKCEVGETYCAAAPVVSNCAASNASLAYLMSNFTVCGVKKAGVH